MATIVRDHGKVEAGPTAAATVTLTLGYDIPAGRVLLAVVGNGDPTSGGSAPSGLSKPVGETTSWTKLADRSWAFPDGDRRGGVSVWAIKTSIPWYATQTIVATWSATRAYRTIAVSEWVGIKAEILGAVSGDSTIGSRNPPVLNVATTATVQAGDLVLTAGSMYTGNYQPYYALAASGTATVESSPSWVGSARPGDYPNYWEWNKWRAEVVTGPGNRAATWTTQYGSPATGYPASALMIALPADDYAPYAPSITSMSGGVTLNRNRTNRLTWTFSSPNAVDNQSKADIRYRAAGSSDAWTTITQTGTASLRDFTASTFAAGNYEIQVKTYGALGKESPWSALGYFTMADPPGGAVIIYPIDGQAVDQLEHVTWSTPDQDVYQFRRLGDDPENPGTPNPDDVIYDSGEVTDTTTRTLPITFAVNGRDEHLQVRVKVDGLWQDEWDSVRVEVSYTPPPTPTRVLYTDPGTASLLVEITNPEPTGDDPAAVNNEIWINDGNGWERRAVGLPLNAVWRYWLPVSGRDYSTSIRVVAVAANGTTASST